PPSAFLAALQGAPRAEKLRPQILLSGQNQTLYRPRTRVEPTRRGRAQPDHLMATSGPASPSAAKRPRRVCIAPNDVASYYSGLRDGLAAQGIECWFFCFDYTPYTRYRPLPSAPWLERAVYRVASSPALAASFIGRLVSKFLLLT